MPNQNYGQIRYGNKDGEIRFGYVDSIKNTHAFLVRSGDDPQHFFSMLSSVGKAKTRGHLNNGTILKSPGSLQIDAGSTVDSDLPGVFIDANSGELILKSNSNVRIQGKNITLISTGSGDDGSITIEANEKININGKQGVSIKSSVGVNIVSEKTVQVIADNILKIFGNAIEFADASSTSKIGKRSKYNPFDATGRTGSPFEEQMSLRGAQ